MSQIILTDTESGKKYTLEFDKESVKFAEGRGFDINDVAKYPMTKISELFFYAFRMHHRNVAREKTDKLLEGIGALPENFLERLINLYSEPFAAFNGDEDGENHPFVKVE